MIKKTIFIFVALVQSLPVFADTRFKLTDKIPNLTGNGEYSAIELSLANGIHTGAGNKIYGIKIPDMALNAGANGSAISIGQGWHNGIRLATNLPIYFDAVTSPIQVYHDGTLLNIYGGELKIWGDTSLAGNGLKEFDRLAIKNDDLAFGSCTQDQIRIDNGGPTKELCYCDSGDWLCTALRVGPMD